MTYSSVVWLRGAMLLAFVWLICGFVSMCFLLNGKSSVDQLVNLYDVIKDFIPSLMRMEKISYFDSSIAKSHASLMLLAAPVLFGMCFFVSFKGLFSGVISRGRNNAVRIGVVFFAIGSISLFSGFGSRGLGGVFLNNPYAFSFLSSLVVANIAYCYRISILLVFNK